MFPAGPQTRPLSTRRRPDGTDLGDHLNTLPDQRGTPGAKTGPRRRTCLFGHVLHRGVFLVVGGRICTIDGQTTTGRSPPKADITSGLTMRHAASDAGSARHRLGRAYLSLAHHQASARTGDAQRSRTSAMIDPGDQSNGALLEQYRRASVRPSHRRFASGKVRRGGHWPGRPSDDRAKKSAKGKKSMNRDKKRSLNPAKRIIA